MCEAFNSPVSSAINFALLASSSLACVPFASGVASDASTASDGELEATEFGDLGLALKGVLWRDCCCVWSSPDARGAAP